MTKMAKDLLKLSAKDLEKRIEELRKELIEQKRARAAGELMNPHAIKKTRRTIATGLTLLGNSKQADEKKEETK